MSESLPEIKSVARKYLASKYGELVEASEPEFDKRRSVWEIKLFTNYPRMVKDDREPDKPLIRFFFLDDIGRIILDDKLSLVNATSRDDLVKNIRNRNAIYRERAERIFVKASAENLSRLSEAMHALNPVKNIVDSLIKPIARPVITHDDIGKDDKPQRVI